MINKYKGYILTAAKKTHPRWSTYFSTQIELKTIFSIHRLVTEPPSFWSILPHRGIKDYMRTHINKCMALLSAQKETLQILFFLGSLQNIRLHFLEWVRFPCYFILLKLCRQSLWVHSTYLVLVTLRTTSMKSFFQACPVLLPPLPLVQLSCSLYKGKNSPTNILHVNKQMMERN